MRITLPTQAQDYYGSEAEKLLLLLRPTLERPQRDTSRLSTAHQPVHTITEDQVKNFGTMSTVDGFGHQKARFFHTDRGFIGLVESDYDTFEKFVDQLAGRAEIRPYLSERYIADTTFKWFEERYKGSVEQSGALPEYLISRAEEDIKDRKIAIPLSYVVIQNPFSIGKVRLEFYTKEFFDELEQGLLANNAKVDPEGMKRLRKKYQGTVFATMNVCAEQERCIEIATEETDNVLLVLRFLSPTTFLPEIPSYFGRMGQATVPVSHCFIFEGKLPTIQEQIDEMVDFRLTLDEQQLSVIRTAGLEMLIDLVTKEKPNDLENLLLKSISLFAKGTTLRDHQDKVVFSLASIETLLLMNSAEPIQHSVGLRLAFLASNKAQDRKRMRSLIRSAYDIRSSYLHHGRRKEDIQLLTELQHTIWTALRNVMLNRSRFVNQAQLIDFIEDMIVS